MKGGIWMQKIQKLMKKIEADPQNTEYTKAGIQPLFSAPRRAKILIVGQAPGIKAQESRLFWNDKSGDNLRTWMGVTRDFFINPIYLQLCRWITIIQEKVNLEIFHHVKVLPKNGMKKL